MLGNNYWLIPIIWLAPCVPAIIYGILALYNQKKKYLKLKKENEELKAGK